MLGREVVRATGGEAISRAELDVTDSRAVSGVIGPGDLAINCAAWTDVDGAEEHPGEALRVNAEGAGKRATAAANPRHFIVRSAWLFGPGGRNFVDTMLRLGPELRVVDDQVGCPTFTGHLAEGLAALVMGEDFGVHHMAASGSCSWFEFAGEIFALAGRDVQLTPCTTDLEEVVCAKG